MKRIRMRRACDVPMSAMTPVAGGHRCAECHETVYDLHGVEDHEVEPTDAPASPE